MAKKPKPKKQVWLVKSGDDDQEQTFDDVVVARTSDEAKAKVQKLRGSYAFTDYAESLDDAIECLMKIKRKSITQVEKEWRKFCRNAY